MNLDNFLIKIQELGFKLPIPPTPTANYLPYTTAGNLVFISGQLPITNGVIKHRGHIVQESQLEQAREAAILCALNILSQVNIVCSGDLSIVKQCIKLCGFVNASNDFLLHSKVIDAASELMLNVFGSKGNHARIAVGCSSLPFNAMVEIDAIFELYTKNHRRSDK